MDIRRAPQIVDPAIPDERAWCKFGEHEEHGEHSICDSNTLFVTKNTLFVNQMTQNTLLYGISGEQIIS